MAEWSKALAWKVSNTLKGVRGFESHPLRQYVSGDSFFYRLKCNCLQRDEGWPESIPPSLREREGRSFRPSSATHRSMVARVCIFATTGHEPRQARKGAAVEALSRAPKSCGRGPPPQRRARIPGACLSIPHGRERDGFDFSRGGGDEVGFDPNEETTTTNEFKSVRSRRVGSGSGVCGVARLVRGDHHGRRRAPCIRSLALPTRLMRNTQTGSR